MNKLFRKYYLILGIFLLSCSAKDGGNRDDFFVSNLKQERISELDREFRSENISKIQIEGFKIRAQQKVKDFIDFTAIISNPDYPEILKNKAREEVKNLFKENSNYLSSSDSLQFSMEEFIEGKTKINLRWINEANLNFPEGKMGVIQAVLRAEGIKNQDQKITFNFNIHLIKTHKKFGENMLEVWEVRLGDLEFVTKDIAK
ncbi:MAG: hypothetical protein KTR26_20925 [Flammeovirgaceae bacterium]|nr:hypothetical protein [Flammeovirgaceae bacterium]